MIWAQPTWILLHTIAEKINYNEYNKERKNIIILISKIIRCLPCPNCRSHACKYLRDNKLPQSVNTKRHLRTWLWKFHNSVNKRTKKKELPISVLDQYSNYSIIEVVNNWKINFNSPNYPLQDFMIRKKINECKFHLTTYIKNNRYKFTGS